MGNKLNNPNTSQKTYWKIINKVMNKCKAPKISPLFVNRLFILNCRENANLFTDFFLQLSKPVINHSILPNFNYLTNEKIEQIPIENEDVISLIRKLNPNNIWTNASFMRPLGHFTPQFSVIFYRLPYILICENVLM